MTAVIMTVFLAAGCAEDSKNETVTGYVTFEGIYKVDSISMGGIQIPQDNATARINSQDNKSICAAVIGLTLPEVQTEPTTAILYGETLDALNLRYENGKYILPVNVTSEGQNIALDIVMTKIASYAVNTGIGNLRNIFKLTANDGKSISTNSGTITYTASIETDSSASDFDFVMAEVVKIKDGVYVLGETETTDSVNGSAGETTSGLNTVDITYNLISKENNIYQYEITANNLLNEDTAYYLMAVEKNANVEPNNAAITLIKQTVSAASAN